MAFTKKQKTVRYVIYSALGLAVLAVLSYVLVIRPLQIRHQKAQFDKAEANIDALALQIENTIGKPDDSKKVKSCSYASREIGKGPRGCGIQYGSVYGVKDSSSAYSVHQKLEEVLRSSSSPFSITYSSGKTFSPLMTDNQVQTSGYDIAADNSNIHCSINLTYAKSKNSDLLISSNSQSENLSIELSCGGPAMTEFFPLKD